jgi:hypothetical protein
MNTKQPFAAFTVCNLYYLPKALVLAASFAQYHPGHTLNIFLFDRKIDADFSALPAKIHWIEDAGVPDLHQLAFKYDIIEFSTSLKPFLTLKLLESADSVIFLDPDTCLFHDLQPVLDDLAAHSIVLTPHYTSPQSDDLGESDVAMMRFGSFNLGFYAVNGSEQGRAFLRWWSRRCIDLCYMEAQFGLSTDQKWITIAPALFQDLHVSFNPGYNAAPWNTFERRLSRDGEGKLWVNGAYPLIFFHFSNFDPSDPEYLNKRAVIERGVRMPELLRLSEEYAARLRANTIDASKVRYGFGYMSGGEYISPTLRRAYVSVLPELPRGHDPFDSAGVVGQFARKNHLFESKPITYAPLGMRHKEGHRGKLKLVYFLMRGMLRVLGPNRFQNLSQLLVYLSSYRQNRGLWKL